MIHLVLLVLPVVFAGNAPSDWACKPLTTIVSSVEGCVASSSYANGEWAISTSTDVNGKGSTKFCVVELSGEDVHKSKDFYVKARFSNGLAGKPGPFGGITFNMEDANDGNYVMMRLKVPVAANVQMGKIVKGVGSQLAQSSETNSAVASGAATLEILVNKEQETVWIDGVLEESISSAQPFFVAPGSVGFGFQAVTAWPDIRVTGAEVCAPVTCESEDGASHSGGEKWLDDDGKTCTCSAAGINCVCGDDSLVCPGGTQKWIDPETCEAKCIRSPAYCSSTGDPHYRSFDGKYYDFHGQCTYQAASCEDFVVNFKNVDLYNRAPRYTKRMELLFKGHTFSIQAGNIAAVEGATVQVPYIKTYTNGDRVEIINNGQLEILMYNKGRTPSVRLRQTNYGTWINAEMWLHGSCADVTEGLCGSWNGNANDDLIDNNPNTNGEHFKKYDENCPPPPEPYHPCDEIPNGKEDAENMCSAFKEAPFTSCHNTVSIGDADSGVLGNCVIDVCHCFLDHSCACSQLDNYAQSCINNGIDLSNWRVDVEYCPYKCPEGQVYNAAGATPVPTCLDQTPDKTGTVRGCFCPGGQFLQDKVCVNANQCKCLYEGQFYNNGDKIEEKAECKVCTCQNAGAMVCEDSACPALNCDDNELVARKDDECCSYCDGSWVEAVNPDNTIKKGQKVVLTCAIHVEGVLKKDIVWYRGDEKITKGISRNKLRLTISDADADDDGEYRCEATKDGKVNSGTFDVDVVMPAICEHEDGSTWEEGQIYNPQQTEACTCDARGEHTCACIDDGEKCEDPTPVLWFNDECVKTCVPDFGSCTAAADPNYNTFDGSQYNFKGACKYNFFGCGDIKMYADHEKDKASTKTKYLEVAFKNDVYKLEGDKVTINGAAFAVPLHKTYGDGSVLSMSDVGIYTLTIVHDGKDPLVELTWDKAASYSLKVHGTCKGFSTGMCGKWNDKPGDDYTMPDEKVAGSVEDFGTAWAVDDFEDCPAPPPLPDICLDYGIGDDDKDSYVAHVKSVLNDGVLGECSDAMKQEETDKTIDSMVQEICGCFGDNSCVCPLLDQFATKCEANGFNIASWKLDNKHTICTPDCPTGATFKAAGPKPAPTCRNHAGGKKTQKGCFCPEGQVVEGGACMDVSECRCEYAGKRYGIGEKFTKDAECLSCKCIEHAEATCDDIKCKTKCKADEVEVKVDDECCPQCLANWVEAVNPLAEGTIKEALELTCKVSGVEVTADNIKWVKFNPGEEDVSKIKRHYSISDDGLTLTIKSMNEMRVGNYKCIVAKDGKSSEGVFQVTLPIVHEDLIKAVKETVSFVEGKDIVLEVTKLGGTITDLYWECNGKKIESGKGGAKIISKKTMNKLILKGASLDMVGSCTCYVKGVGSEDSAEIKIEGLPNVAPTVTLTPVKSAIICKEGKKRCSLKFNAEKTAGKINKKRLEICRVLAKGDRGDCKKVKKRKGQYYRGVGKVSKGTAGEYVLVHEEDGVEVVSDPITVAVKAKTPKRG